MEPRIDEQDRNYPTNLKSGLSIVQDFYLEFFGVLLPGVLAVTVVLLLCLGFHYFASDDFEVAKSPVLLMFKNWQMTLLFLAISYIMGAVAYRRTPKTPDAIASFRQWRATRSGTAKDEVGRLAVTYDSSAIAHGIANRIRYMLNREKWISRHSTGNNDYPYPHMRQYLCCRGFTHLADYVPWCSGSGGPNFKEYFEKGKCSKHYINVIKQRIRNSGRSALMLDMVRNECNIRMLNSLWYVLTFSLRILLLAIVAAAGVFLIKTIAQWKAGSPQYSLHCPMTATTPSRSVACKGSPVVGKSIPVKSTIICRLDVFTQLLNRFMDADSKHTRWFFVLLASAVALVVYCRRGVEEGFHYVRTREVTMILESAWILDNVIAGGDAVKPLEARREGLFKDIKDRADKFKNSHCTICKYFKQCYATTD